VTGESLGLLVEEQRTNLLVRSEEFDNASWLKANASVTANSISAPSGAATADTLVEDNALSAHVLQQSANVVSGTAYTLSCYAKPAGRNFAQLLMLGGFAANITAFFDITTGAVGTTAGSPTVTSTNVGNGWYRLSITATAISTTSTAIQLRPASSSSTAFYQGDGTSGIYVWGAQLEAGAFPTSYIPTTTAAVTRSADVASITGSAFSSWYSQDEGTMFADVTVLSTAKNNQVISIDDGTSGNRIELRVLAVATTMRHDMAAGGVTQNTGSITVGTDLRRVAALGYRSGDTRLQSGSIGNTFTGATVPTVTQIQLNKATFANGEINGTIRRLTFWPQRLANSTLQTLSQ
jgi:hypothetical protein